MGLHYNSKVGGEGGGGSGSVAEELFDSTSSRSSTLRDSHSGGTAKTTYWRDPEKGYTFTDVHLDASTDEYGSEVVVTQIPTKKKSHRLRNVGTLIGGFLSITATGGTGTAVGLLQRYWEDHQLREYSPRDVGWIAGTSICLTLFLPVVAGPIYDRYGHFWILVAGTLCFCCGILSVSFLDERVPEHLCFAMLVLSWGILCGIGNGLVSTATAGVVCRIFDKRRGLASGIVSGGNSVGGIIWPMLLRDTLDRWGWQWALKLVTGISCLLLIAGIALIRDLPDDAEELNRDHTDEDEEEEEIIIKAKPLRRTTSIQQCVQEGAGCFKKATFVWMTLSLAIAQFVIMGIVGTLPSWGDEQGFQPDQLFNIVAVMNAASGVGRVATGAAGDFIGHYNSVILIQVSATAIVYGLFFNIHQDTSLFYVFCALWGFMSGAILSMMNVLIREQCQSENFGRHLSASYSVISIAGLVCVPLSSQMLLSFGPQMHVIFFGTLLAVSAALMIVTRWGLMGYQWKWLVTL